MVGNNKYYVLLVNPHISTECVSYTERQQGKIKDWLHVTCGYMDIIVSNGAKPDDLNSDFEKYCVITENLIKPLIGEAVPMDEPVYLRSQYGTIFQVASK